MRAWSLALAAVVGCAESHDGAPADSDVLIGEDGRSEEIVFEVPEGARSVTVVAEGAPSSFLAIASLEWADGSSVIELPGAPADALRQVGPTLYPFLEAPVPQFVRQGTFSWLYPRVVEQALPPGPARLRIASTDAGGSADVTILTPRDDGASVLHVSLASASDRFAFTEPPPAFDGVRTTFERAGIDVVVDSVVALDGHDVGPFLGTSYPTPDGPEAALVHRAHAAGASTGVLVMIVDAFDAVGYTLGLPGPPLPDTDYSGVVVSDVIPGTGDPDAKLAHVIAHEVAHFLGLTHLYDYGPNDEEIPDAFDDTGSDDRNLMGSLAVDSTPTDEDSALTPRQRWALSRSALLVAE